MALCHGTKTQSACMDKMSPLLLPDRALGETQTVLPRSVFSTMPVSPPPFLSKHPLALPKRSALTCSLTLQPSPPGSSRRLLYLSSVLPHSPLSSVSTLHLCLVSKTSNWCMCTYECTSVQTPGSVPLGAGRPAAHQGTAKSPSCLECPFGSPPYLCKPSPSVPDRPPSLSCPPLCTQSILSYAQNYPVTVSPLVSRSVRFVWGTRPIKRTRVRC